MVDEYQLSTTQGQDPIKTYHQELQDTALGPLNCKVSTE